MTDLLTESHWPADTSATIRDITVTQLLRHAAATVPDRVALVDAVTDPDRRRSWTYVQYLADVERIARHLLGSFAPGERVAIWAPNSADWVLLQQALLMAGIVAVPVNPAYRAHELGYALAQSGAAGLVHTPGYRGGDQTSVIRDLSGLDIDLSALRHVLTLEAVAAGEGPATVELPEVEATTPIQIQYTSGTTGTPKGALLHQMGLVNAADLVAERAGMADGDSYVNAMPMYHIGGGAVLSFGAIARRGTFVVMPGFDAGLMLECVETYRGTHTLVVPTMLLALLDHPDRSTRDLSSLRTVMAGATAVPAALIRRAIDELGCAFSSPFGQTEVHGIITQSAPGDSVEDQSETVGRPLPQVEVRIVDVATGRTQPLGEPGEVCCRGYQTMIGYHEMPEATAATIDAEGWLHMGDLGTLDERGFLRITGRLKDMVIRGGLNIYPREIEELLVTHPAIATATVVGVPDEKWGEQLAAVVTLTDGVTEPPLLELHEFCRGRMSAHKTPAFWSIADELPVTGTGKIQKFALRDQIVQGDLPLASAR